MAWSEREDNILTDLLIDTRLSIPNIAKELSKKPQDVKDRVKTLGLEWIRRKRGYASHGQGILTEVIQELLPGEPIESEHQIGSRLRLDIYCPTYKIAAEYHGRQHFEFVEHFHKDRQGFQDAQARDREKLERCKELGIGLVVFTYRDKLTKEAVFEKLLGAIRSTPYVEEEKQSNFKGNPYYEEMKRRNREYRRKRYQELKSMRGKREQ